MKSMGRSGGGNKGGLFLVLIFVILVAVTTFIAFSLKVDTVDESLKNGVHKKIVTRFPPEPNA